MNLKQSIFERVERKAGCDQKLNLSKYMSTLFKGLNSFPHIEVKMTDQNMEVNVIQRYNKGYRQQVEDFMRAASCNRANSITLPGKIRVYKMITRSTLRCRKLYSE